MDSIRIIELLDPPDIIPIHFVGDGVSTKFTISDVMKVIVYKTVPISDDEQ